MAGFGERVAGIPESEHGPIRMVTIVAACKVEECHWEVTVTTLRKDLLRSMNQLMKLHVKLHHNKTGHHIKMPEIIIH